mgnify:CR=1 FL=1
MKANVLLSSCFMLTLLSACAPKVPPPAPVPPPVVTTAPAPLPAPRPLADWRDMPLSPGGWRWAAIAGQSTASFAQAGQAPLARLTCVAPGSVQIILAGSIAGATPMGVTTSAGSFPLMAEPTANGAAATLPARSPVLDAMATSRGRFVIEIAGQAASYLPSWPEVARVIEDCR